MNRPPMRYFGGKWRIAPWIISQFPPHRIYVEPYGGGGSVLLRKPRSYGEVYNDLDGRVVNVFRVLQDRRRARRLERLLRVTPFARDEFELSYGRSKDPTEDARLTIIASFMGFGSDSVTRSHRTGFRTNSNRSGTTPAKDWSRYPDSIALFSDRLRGVAIENRDAIEVMRSQDSPDTLHYVDPPYVHSTRSRGSWQGYRHELTDQLHRQLVEYLAGIQGMVVLSGYSTPIYDGLGWTRIEAKTLVMGNHERTEVLWLNDSAAAARAQGELFGRMNQIPATVQDSNI